MKAIPLPLDAPFVSIRTNLDGAEYLLTVEYNMRSGWYVGVTAPDGEVLCRPRKLQPFVNVLSGLTSTKRPPGVLTLVPLNRDDDKPLLADLGRSHYLVYATAAEMEAASA